MKFLDLTLATPAHNLALDQALLDEAEAYGTTEDVLRVWESDRPVVVVGRSTRVAQEVDLAACRAARIDVLRRVSGGASVVAGPGCLMYAVILSCERRPELRMIDRAHRYVLETVARGLRTLVDDVSIQGISDLTRGTRKFSGNSLRCQRHHILYHGTILYQFPLAWLSRYLNEPPRQPDYRQQRRHEAFVDNFPATRPELTGALRAAWNADQALQAWPTRRVEQLAAERYTQDTWNLRL